MSVEKRLLLALGISAVVVILWSVFLMPPPQQQPTTPAETTEETTADDGGESMAPAEEGQDAPAEGEETGTADEGDDGIVEENLPVAAEAEQTVVVDTDLYHVVLSNAAGGSVVSWQLKDFEATFAEQPLDLIADKRFHEAPFAPYGTVERNETMVRDGEGEKAIVDYRPFPGLPTIVAELDGDNVVFTEGKATVSFEYYDPSFGRVIKRFTFYESGYGADIAFDRDVPGLDRNSRLMLTLGPGVGQLFRVEDSGKVVPANEANGFIMRKSNAGVDKPVAMIREAGAPADGDPVFQDGRINDYLVWAGLENNYFMELFYADASNGFSPSYRVNYTQQAAGGDETKYYSVPYLAVHPERASSEFRLFVGPKDLELLEKYSGGRLKDVVKFGMFGFISRPALWVLKQIYSFVHNYGFAIILLTIALNLILLPLMVKQRKSMQAMQKLQPQIKQIQAKYKADKGDDIKTRQAKKQKLNEETMALYKQENVNPMGGCLPLLIQFPILFALFDMIKVAIELRKAPFILWWTNLSAPDPTFVLPVLMAVFMFLTQRLTPTPTDSQSGAGAMKILPFVFLFFFAAAPSALVLYWLTSTLFNFGTQLVLSKTSPVTASPAKPAPQGKGSKKSRGKK